MFLQKPPLVPIAVGRGYSSAEMLDGAQVITIARGLERTSSSSCDRRNGGSGRGEGRQSRASRASPSPGHGQALPGNGDHGLQRLVLETDRDGPGQLELGAGGRAETRQRAGVGDERP